MITEKILDILLSFVGLVSAIGFRYFGKKSIEERKRLNSFFPRPFRLSDESFDKYAVFLTQIGFLFFGIFVFLVGIAKFLS